MELAIANNDLSTYQNILTAMSHQLDDDWLISLFTALYRQGKHNWLELTFNTLDDQRLPELINSPLLHLKTRLFMIYNLQDQVLSWLHRYYPQPGYVPMILELNNYVSEPSWPLLLNRLYLTVHRSERIQYNNRAIWQKIIQELGPQPWDFAQTLNTRLLSWLLRRDPDAHAAQPGNWIDTWQFGELETRLNEGLRQLPYLRKLSYTELAAEVNNEITAQNYDVYLHLANYRYWLKQLDTNWELQRQWGPFNRFYTQKIIRVPENAKELIHHLQPMLMPNINYSPGPLDEDFYEDDPDWFNGYCHQCLCSMPERKWALRRMLDAGGWTGCYCSWNCVIWSLNEPNDQQLVAYELARILGTRIYTLSGQPQVVPELKLDLTPDTLWEFD